MSLHRLNRIVRTAAVAGLLLPAVTACGGGSTPATVKTTLAPAKTTSTVGTTTTTIDPDGIKAKAGLLTVSDLPAGWSASPNPSGSGIGSSGPTAELASCLGVPAAGIDSNVPQASSPTFNDANQADTVDDQVQVYPTAAAAAAVFSLFSSPKSPSCITKLFNGPLKGQFTTNLQPGQTLVSVSSAAKPFPRLGDHSGDVQTTFVLAVSGVNVKVVLDLIVITIGRSETIVTLTQPQALATPALAAQLGKAAAAHMTA